MPMEPILPEKLKRNLLKQIEEALKENINKSQGNYSVETVYIIRQAFFNLIVDLFQNYKYRVVVNEGETVFMAKTFIDESDPNHKEFFKRFL